MRLQQQPFLVLKSLLENSGQIVTREELKKKIWPEDTFVDFDHGLHSAVNRLRDALGDSAENPRFIETLPRRGYRFIAPVTVVARPQSQSTHAAPTGAQAVSAPTAGSAESVAVAAVPAAPI